MEGLYNNAGMLKQETEMSLSPRFLPPTKRQQLTQKKQQLEAMLEIVNKAIAALDAHPDLEEFSETLARAL